MLNFDLVHERIYDAQAIAWDTCHKIYLLMDDEQVALMREYEYDPLITSDDMTDHEMYETVKRWYDESCSLRFIDAVSTVDGESKFEVIIGQFDDDEDENDDDDDFY